MKARILLVQLLLLASLCCLSCERQMAVTQEDKALCVRVADLKRFGYEFKEIEKYETFTKRKNFDGSIEVEYEFDSLDAEPEDGLYLIVRITTSGTKSGARGEQAAEKLAMLSGMKFEGAVLEEKNDFYMYGDNSSFFVLKKDGEVGGHYFITRQGTKTYSLVLVGIEFVEPEGWKALVEPKLKLFSAYNPTESR